MLYIWSYTFKLPALVLNMSWCHYQSFYNITHTCARQVQNQLTNVLLSPAHLYLSKENIEIQWKMKSSDMQCLQICHVTYWLDSYLLYCGKVKWHECAVCYNVITHHYDNNTLELYAWSLNFLLFPWWLHASR